MGKTPNAQDTSITELGRYLTSDDVIIGPDLNYVVKGTI